jgi:hypothetical protein
MLHAYIYVLHYIVDAAIAIQSLRITLNLISKDERDTGAHSAKAS